MYKFLIITIVKWITATLSQTLWLSTCGALKWYCLFCSYVLYVKNRASWLDCFGWIPWLTVCNKKKIYTFASISFAFGLFFLLDRKYPIKMPSPMPIIKLYWSIICLTTAKNNQKTKQRTTERFKIRRVCRTTSFTDYCFSRRIDILRSEVFEAW